MVIFHSLREGIKHGWEVPYITAQNNAYNYSLCKWILQLRKSSAAASFLMDENQQARLDYRVVQDEYPNTLW